MAKKKPSPAPSLTSPDDLNENMQRLERVKKKPAKKKAATKKKPAKKKDSR